MFKVNNKISSNRYLFAGYAVSDKVSKSVTQTVEQVIHWQYHGCFYCQLETYFTLFFSVSIVEFEQVKYILGFQ